MGLTIHYSARLKSLDLLPQLVNEVADICQSIGWEYDEVDKVKLCSPQIGKVR